MKTLLNSADYFDAAIFQMEQERIFRRSWVFVGYESQLASTDDWITANLGGVDVFIQNCGGNLRGFVNSCSHRFSRIRQGECGNGAIQCPYHGWRFGHDGCPTAIPSKPRFDDLTPQRIRELALQSVAVEKLGPLVFARLGSEGESLAAALGFLGPRISAMAEATGEKIGSVEIDIAANWKLVVENTLEGYHLAWVHEQTFGRLNMAYPKFELQENHAMSYARVSDEALRSFARVNSLFKNRPVTTDGYIHSVVFPNFGAASLYGMTFAFQRFVPSGPERTKLRIDVFGTRLNSEISARDRALLNQLFTSALEFSRKVCAEDQAIVELQQLGVRARHQTGILSDEEIRIVAFQREYRRLMQDRCPENPVG